MVAVMDLNEIDRDAVFASTQANGAAQLAVEGIRASLACAEQAYIANLLAFAALPDEILHETTGEHVDEIRARIGAAIEASGLLAH